MERKFYWGFCIKQHRHRFKTWSQSSRRKYHGILIPYKSAFQKNPQSIQAGCSGPAGLVHVTLKPPLVGQSTHQVVVKSSVLMSLQERPHPQVSLLYKYGSRKKMTVLPCLWCGVPKAALRGPYLKRIVLDISAGSDHAVVWLGCLLLAGPLTIFNFSGWMVLTLSRWRLRFLTTTKSSLHRKWVKRGSLLLGKKTFGFRHRT